MNKIPTSLIRFLFSPLNLYAFITLLITNVIWDDIRIPDLISKNHYFIPHQNTFDVIGSSSCVNEYHNIGISYSQTNIDISNCFFSRSSLFSGNGGVIAFLVSLTH